MLDAEKDDDVDDVDEIEKEAVAAGAAGAALGDMEVDGDDSKEESTDSNTDDSLSRNEVL